MNVLRPVLLILILTLICFDIFAQNVTNHEVEPTGVYKQVATNLQGDINIAMALLDSTTTDKSKLIDSVEDHANNFIPPVLYILSGVLYNYHKFNEAAFWFYVAQLRARYDVNRCTDKTASAATYNMNYGPSINDYALKHLDTLEKIVARVVSFVRMNDELYDQRWINLNGMQAVTEGLGGDKSGQPLSVDRKKWPAIKQQTVDSYFSDFEEMLASYRKKQKN